MTGRQVRSFNIKKSIVAPIGVMAVLATSLAVALPAQAGSGADVEFGEWAFTHYTETQPNPNKPADPDNEAGEKNVDNVIKIGEVYTHSEPGADHVEFKWATESPGEDWVQQTGVDHRADEVIPATTDTPQQRWSWNPHGSQDETNGPGPGSTPLTDPGHWQDNTSHYNGTDPLGQAFQEGHGNGGNNASWFYWTYTPGTAEHTVHHDLYEYKLVTETQGPTEYYWAVYERTNSPGDSDPSDTSDPGDPSTPSVPTQVKGQSAQTPSSHPSKPTQSHTPGTNPPAVPTSIDAGL